jgi:hypothetical protein
VAIERSVGIEDALRAQVERDDRQGVLRTGDENARGEIPCDGVQVRPTGDEQIRAGGERRPDRDSVSSSALHRLLGRALGVRRIGRVALSGADVVAEERRLHDVLSVGADHRIGESVVARGVDHEPPGDRVPDRAGVARGARRWPGVRVEERGDEVV